MRRSLSSLGAWIMAICAAWPARANCPTTASESARIAAVEPGLELRLADGRLLRLAGLDPVQHTPQTPDRDEMARAAAARLASGKDARIALLARTPDRWGRLAAFVFLAEAPPREGGLAAALVATGEGRYLAEPAAASCRDALLAQEANARQAKLGLWADPYYAVLAVDDHDAFTERAGTIVVADGRLTAVQTSPYRTTLRFAAPQGGRFGRNSQGRRMLVATILPRTMKTFTSHGIDLQRLIGRELRVRGLLDLRFGPQIEIAGPDALEVAAAPAAAPAAAASKPAD